MRNWGEARILSGWGVSSAAEGQNEKIKVRKVCEMPKNKNIICLEVDHGWRDK